MARSHYKRHNPRWQDSMGSVIITIYHTGFGTQGSERVTFAWERIRGIDFHLRLLILVQRLPEQLITNLNNAKLFGES